MQTAGVICEYNPFHLGHARQLELIRQQLGQEAAIVCLMSGNYVQRGEPAVFDKCVRARAAVEAGASLVLELPVTYALRSASVSMTVMSLRSDTRLSATLWPTRPAPRMMIFISNRSLVLAA